MNKRFNNCLRAPSGLIDPYNLFFYTHSVGNEDLDFLTLNHEISGHGINGIDKMISLLILSSKNKEDYIDSVRNILEALAYDEDILKIKKAKIDPYMSDFLKKRPDFEDIQEISKDVADIIKLAEANTGVTLSHREIYKIILHYWRIPLIDKLIKKKDIRKISETIEEIKNILSKFKKEIYLFSWEEIPGKNDTLILTEFLKYNYGVDWIKTAKIAKTENFKTIIITDEKNYLSLNLNDENTELYLKIDNVKTDIFIVKTENGKLKIYKETTYRGLLIQLREELLKKNFKLFGHFDYPFDFLPFGPELIMCFELFNENSKERRREIFAHLLNALTLNASRGIVLPYDATDEIYLQMLTIKMKYKTKDVELKTPLYVFFPPLLIYPQFKEQELSDLKSDLSNCGFNYHFAKIAFELNKKKTTSKKHTKKTTNLDNIFKNLDDVLSSFVLTHEACDLISVYLLNFSGFLLTSMITRKMPMEVGYHINPNQRQVIGPTSGSIKLTVPNGYEEIVDSFDSSIKEKHMEILRYFFWPESQMQKVKNNLQKTASKTELLQLKNITLENKEFIATLPFDMNSIMNIQKFYEKVFEKKGDIFGFIINFPEIYKKFNEIIHETASEYFCPDEICSESILNARKGIMDFKSTVELNKNFKYFEKKYPDIHIVKAFYNI